MTKRQPRPDEEPRLQPVPERARDRAEARRGHGRIARQIRAAKLPGIDEINGGKKTANRILSVAKVIESIFLIAVVVLLGASTLLIANTIRLSIFSRRREIEVMKLVGATNWFVRGPFMLEGLIAASPARSPRSSCSCWARSSHWRRSCTTSTRAPTSAR